MELTVQKFLVLKLYYLFTWNKLTKRETISVREQRVFSDYKEVLLESFCLKHWNVLFSITFAL